MSVLDSDKIAVFPSSQRDTQQSRLITESRLASFVRNSIDSKGFVISYSSNIIEFYIMGYYFVCDIQSVLPSSGDSLYATIRIVPSTDIDTSDVNTGLYDTLAVIDELDPTIKTYGVEFDTDAPTIAGGWAPTLNDDINEDDCVWINGTYYKMKLLTNDDGTYVANTNHFKVNKANNVVIVDNTVANSTEIINIDCGSLDS